MEDNTLNKYWDSLKNEEYSSSFKNVDNWIRKENFNGITKSASHKSSILRTFSENKIKYAVILASIFIIYFTGKIPVTQNKAIGNILSWNVEKNSYNAISQIDDFKWLDKSKLIVSDTTIDNKEMLTYKMLLPPELDKSQLALISNDLLNISRYNIIPIFEPVKRPAYSAALFSLFNLDLTTEHFNQLEVYDNIAEQLKHQGLDDEVDIDIDNINDFNEIPRIIHILPRKELDSIRIKIHNDIIRNINIDKSVHNVERSLREHNIRINSDSIIKKIVINMDDKMLKHLSEDNYIFDDYPVIDSIKIRFINEKIKQLNVRIKNLQDSVLNKIGKNIVINIDIPDIGNIVDSVTKNIDFESLKDIKIKVLDDSKMLELENLDERIKKEVDENLKDLEININMDLDSIQYFHDIPVIPDSTKAKLKNLKIKIKNHKEEKEIDEEKEEEN